MPELDGLRALAVTFVMYDHWAPPRFNVESNFGISLSALGVHLFFVLSGFLITGILLGCRDRARIGERISLAPLRTFYARRILRIFPAYYVLLAILFALGVPPVRQALAWQAAYLSNVYACLGHPLGWVSHFWSLSVEEQFYLVWPWIIVYAPDRWLERIVLSSIAVGALSRLALFPIFGGTLRTFILPFACLDSLGVGAWLAVIERRSDTECYRSHARWLGRIALAAILPMAVVYWLFRRGSILPAVVLGVTFQAPMLGWIVLRASRGESNSCFAYLRSWPLVWLGQISYGVYLFHAFMPSLVRRSPKIIAYAASQHTASMMVLSFLFTVIAAQISWMLIEGPMNGLKRYLPYEA
jgi:peptidoglycan/LPS O-acetylase OafA/YrhL